MRQTQMAWLVASILMLLVAPLAMGQSATLISVNQAGTGGGNLYSSSTAPVISANKRFIVFLSTAKDLVPNDTNGSTQDIFIRDLIVGTTQLVSVNSAGTGSGNGESKDPVISADGRYVAFTSKANDLVTNDTNIEPDVFVRDLQMQTTKLVSINLAGTASGNSSSVAPVISTDGRFITFASAANDLVPTECTGGNIFLRDLVLNKTTLVSINSTGTASGFGDSFSPVMSSNGRFVAYISYSHDLTTDEIVHTPNIFVRDLVAHTTALVSVDEAGTGSGNQQSYSPVISSNGRFVAFVSRAGNLVSIDDTTGTPNVFVRDLVAHTTTLVSINQAGTSGGNGVSGSYFTGDNLPVFGANGRYVAFVSEASDLMANDTNSTADVFVRDLSTHKTSLVSVNSAGTGSGNDQSYSPLISADGRFITFISLAGDLITNELNHVQDLFVRDQTAGTTSLVSLNSMGTGSANCGSPFGTYSISSDGRLIAFGSCASNLIANDTNRAIDVFAVTITGGTLEFGAPSYSVNEGQGTATFKVKRTGSSQGNVSVDYAVKSGQASAGSDFMPISGTLTFANGETSKTLSIPIINDNIDEENEGFVLALSHPTGSALLGAHSSVFVTIIDNDPPPGLTINDVSVSEGNTGKISAVFTVSLSAASTHTVTVNYKTANGTASSSSDYAGQSGRLTFTPGQTAKMITVMVNGDTVREANETFLINLSTPTNATTADGVGVCMILNDD